MSQISGARYLLENESLRVVVSASAGRIESLMSQRTGLEFLLQPHTSHLPGSITPGFDRRFEDSPCAGIDECLPSVGFCDAATPGGPVPDHGDLWQLPWELVGPFTGHALHLQATCFSRPLHLHRTLQLDGAELRMTYRLQNLATQPVAYHYACHPLFAVGVGDRIVLPREVTSLRVYFSNGLRVGTSDGCCTWPRAGATGELDLSIVQPRTAETAEMLYTGQLQHGACGLYRSGRREGILLRFDQTSLPYLGLWICNDAWPERRDRPRQWTVALEPTVTPCGTLSEAISQALAPLLQPGASVEWWMSLDLQQDIPYSEFARSVQDSSSRL
jgi:galactose mutarotase-like enzyme